MLVSSFLLTLGTVSAQETHYVSGTISIDIEWVSGDIYVVTADLTVPAGVNLTIPEGVTVLFDNGTGLLVVGGALIVAGTADLPVVLDANSTATVPGQWRGVNVTGGSVSMANAAIAHAVCGVCAESSAFEMRGSTIAENLAGIVLYNCSNPVLAGNTVEDNDGIGVRITEPSVVSDELTIVGNIVCGNGGSGIEIVATQGIAALTLEDNVFSGNGWFGLSFRSQNDLGAVTITGNNISGNAWIGIWLEIATDYIVDSYSGDLVIRDNAATSNGGDGVFFDGITYGDICVTCNILCHNGEVPFMTNGQQFGAIVVENNDIGDGIYLCIGDVNYDVPEPPCPPVEPSCEKPPMDDTCPEDQVPADGQDTDNSDTDGLSNDALTGSNEDNDEDTTPFFIAGLGAVTAIGALGAVLYARRRDR